jgi:SAM-dependent methyltransferase
MNRKNDPVARYYASCTQAADAALSRAERANDLAEVRERIAALVRGHTVLELACGTGYWTEVIAATADKVLATDLLDEMIVGAQQRSLPEGKVAFRRVDGLDLPDDLGTFSCVFIGFWWSHLKRDEQDALLAQLRARLGRDVVLILLDEAYVEGSSSAWGTNAAAGAGRRAPVRHPARRKRDATPRQLRASRRALLRRANKRSEKTQCVG